MHILFYTSCIFQASVDDNLSPATAITGYTVDLRRLAANKQFIVGAQMTISFCVSGCVCVCVCIVEPRGKYAFGYLYQSLSCCVFVNKCHIMTKYTYCNGIILFVCARARACVCVRACVRACVRVCVCVAVSVNVTLSGFPPYVQEEHCTNPMYFNIVVNNTTTTTTMFIVDVPCIYILASKLSYRRRFGSIVVVVFI